MTASMRPSDEKRKPKVKPPLVADPPIQLQRILRRKRLSAYTGLSRSVIEDLITKGQFPPGIKLNPLSKHSGVRGWLESTIRAWQEERMRALKEEIKQKGKKPRPSWFDKI
jgi:predicted DNA-binding transcriptional regulator AlpA